MSKKDIKFHYVQVLITRVKVQNIKKVKKIFQNNKIEFFLKTKENDCNFQTKFYKFKKRL